MNHPSQIGSHVSRHLSQRILLAIQHSPGTPLRMDGMTEPFDHEVWAILNLLVSSGKVLRERAMPPVGAFFHGRGPSWVYRLTDAGRCELQDLCHE